MRRSRTSSPVSDAFRGAIVGFGEVARHGHWPAYAQNVNIRIVGVVDRTEERRSLAESLIPGVRVFPTLDTLAAEMRVDFVDICTPPALHAGPMREAIARGWHVLCEKPLLLDAGLIDTAISAGVSANQSSARYAACQP